MQFQLICFQISRKKCSIKGIFTNIFQTQGWPYPTCSESQSRGVIILTECHFFLSFPFSDHYNFMNERSGCHSIFHFSSHILLDVFQTIYLQSRFCVLETLLSMYGNWIYSRVRSMNRQIWSISFFPLSLFVVWFLLWSYWPEFVRSLTTLWLSLTYINHNIKSCTRKKVNDRGITVYYSITLEPFCLKNYCKAVHKNSLLTSIITLCLCKIMIPDHKTACTSIG